MQALRDAADTLLLEWARQAAPHYGPAGSMDLDLQDFADADGPSYYNQFAHFSLLLLSEGVVDGIEAEEREHFRRLALANIRYVLSITDGQFHTPHYSRGRDWGRHIGEWLNYYLLGSLELMERFDVGDKELRQAVGVAVVGATEQLVERFRERFRDGSAGFPGNHATWHGLLFHRAGLHFGRRDWVGFSRDFFGRYILPTQQPSGVWPEGDGIVVNYSMVTAQAVSLFAEAADDETARACLERALGFFTAFSLPDGSSAVVADCRMRYHRAPMVFLPPSFLRSSAGRDLCQQRIDACRAHLAGTQLSDNAAQGLAFYGAFVEALMAWPQSSTPAPTPAAAAAPKGTVSAAPALPVARLDSDAWSGFLSWQLTAEQDSRFLLDTQNFIELWHRESGYLVGTGNSKYAPRFSTLRRVDGGRSYIPDAATCLERTATRVECAYDFGSDRILVTLELSGETCRVGFRLLSGVLLPGAGASAGAYEAALLLALARGDVVHIGGQARTVEPTQLLEWRSGPTSAPGFEWRGRTFHVPAGARLQYPIVPHNPYTQHGLPGEEAYVARLSFGLSEDPTPANELQVTIT